MRTTSIPRLATAATALAVVVLASSVTATPSAAATPHWLLTASAEPTNLPPGAEAKILVLASDISSQPVEGAGSPVTLTDKLPPGLTAIHVSSYADSGGNEIPSEFECHLSAAPSCTWPKKLTGYGVLQMLVTVRVDEPAGTNTALRNELSIEGGETPSASASQLMRVSSAPVPFGIEKLEVTPENEDGSLDTQAGSHPFQLTTTLDLNTVLQAVPGGGAESTGAIPAALPKDLHVNLPPGLIGDPIATPKCGNAEFVTIEGSSDLCPADTAIGVVLTTVSDAPAIRPVTAPVPLFNLVPSPGEPARLGFIVKGLIPVVVDTAIRTGGDYGVTVSSNNILQTAGLLSSRVIVWGVPGDSRHDPSRGQNCLSPEEWPGKLFGCPSTAQSQPVPFLTMPTACAGPVESSAEGDSWPAPEKAAQTATPVQSALENAGGRPTALEGCNQLPFDPVMKVQPETHAGSTPTGLSVDLHVPQEPTLASEGLAESDVRATTVTLPEGMQISPSSANALEACSEPQIGFIGETGREFSSTLPEPFCPDASKVGLVHIRTPLLANELEGGVYLAAQNANPFGSLLALYIVAQDRASGVLVKLAGEMHLDQHTGRVSSTFNNTPQLPFENLKLEFFGGARGPVSTPATCGRYETSASLTPWSGSPPAQSASSFPITSGPSGSPCANPLPFSPSLTAGSASIKAAAFTPFTMTMSREDGNQNLAAITLHMPPGLLGKLASVTPCQEPQAARGICGAESLIGHIVTSVGLGPNPYTVPGAVYITGPYRGAPYGLSILTPAIAGPFNLGNVVVRARIEVDRHTSALTITSDPLPRMLQGIPLQIKHVAVTVDRSGFTFNPTNCAQLPIAATISGEQGAVSSVSVPFRVTNCANLPFKPGFTVLTQGRTSKANGVSLHVKVTSSPGQANIGKVRVDLPRQLPSRLTTLQKACPDATFNANPASCPPGSVVGTGTAVTPVLKSPLTGPAYLVSHAGAAFPDLVIVLQGEGITLDLVGNTDIKKGITISTFNSVPDAPISTFDLVLPQGAHSALGANLPASARGSLCRQRLTMPTLITGQNGAVIRQTTKIAVSGCPRHTARKARRAKRGNAERTTG